MKRGMCPAAGLGIWCGAPVQSRKPTVKYKIEVCASAGPEQSVPTWCVAPVQSRKSTVKYKFDCVALVVAHEVCLRG
jgi:hypothetical protein